MVLGNIGEPETQTSKQRQDIAKSHVGLPISRSLRREVGLPCIE